MSIDTNRFRRKTDYSLPLRPASTVSVTRPNSSPAYQAPSAPPTAVPPKAPPINSQTSSSGAAIATASFPKPPMQSQSSQSPQSVTQIVPVWAQPSSAPRASSPRQEANPAASASLAPQATNSFATSPAPAIAVSAASQSRAPFVTKSFEPLLAAEDEPKTPNKNKRRVLITLASSGVIVLLIASAASFMIFKPSLHNATASVSNLFSGSNNQSSASAGSTLKVTDQPAGSNATIKTPAVAPFKPLVPSDQPQLAKLGASAYNAQHGNYSFSNLFLTTPVYVSEQTLPSGYGSAANTVKTIGATFNATTPVGSKTGPSYMATDPKTGTQTIVFAKQNLLIFVRSAYQHSPSVWGEYLDSLQ